MSPVEALTQIRALCQPQEHDSHHLRKFMAEVRAVLDAVSVDATPAQGIDKVALVRTLTEWLEGDYPYEDDTEVDATSVSEGADRILALVNRGA